VAAGPPQQTRDFTFQASQGGDADASLFPAFARFPNIETSGKPTYVESAFASQLKTLPVRLHPM
jgi:hypothetical protein